MAYPTRGIELVVPSNAERAITGRVFTVNFNRRRHDYSATYYMCRWNIERDGARVRRFDDLPKDVQSILVKTKANYAQSA